MSLRLVLEDSAGNVTRQIAMTHQKGQLIQRKDTKRLEVVTDTAALVKQKVAFSKIADLDFEDLQNQGPQF